MKINVLNPNIQTSMKRFIVNKDLDIEYGLGAIKGVADAFIDHVCSIRNENHFKDLWNFSKKVERSGSTARGKCALPELWRIVVKVKSSLPHICLKRPEPSRR